MVSLKGTPSLLQEQVGWPSECGQAPDVMPDVMPNVEANQDFVRLFRIFTFGISIRETGGK